MDGRSFEAFLSISDEKFNPAPVRARQYAWYETIITRYMTLIHSKERRKEIALMLDQEQISLTHDLMTLGSSIRRRITEEDVLEKAEAVYDKHYPNLTTIKEALMDVLYYQLRYGKHERADSNNERCKEVSSHGKND